MSFSGKKIDGPRDAKPNKRKNTVCSLICKNCVWGVVVGEHFLGNQVDSWDGRSAYKRE